MVTVEPDGTGLASVTRPCSPTRDLTTADRPLTKTYTLVVSVVTTPPLVPSTTGTCSTLKMVLLFGPAPPVRNKGLGGDSVAVATKLEAWSEVTGMVEVR